MTKRNLTLLLSIGLLSLALNGCSGDMQSVEILDRMEQSATIQSAGSDSSTEGTFEDGIVPDSDIFLVDNLLKEAPYIQIGDNIPRFAEEEKSKTVAFELYSDLDSLGRCGAAYANIGKELMPTEDRGEIGHIKPTGWVQNKYEGVVNSNPPYLYNRCHLIGFQLAGENDNEKNLITGTRYMNVDGMLPWEDMVAEYVRKTGCHVLYRVTPIFVDNELLCRGVTIEAWSVEDKGKGICFYVFCPNVQPGVSFDYSTGNNWLSSEPVATETVQEDDTTYTYVLNKNSMKYHLPECDSVPDISEKNREEYHGTREELEGKGYVACKKCFR